MPIATYGELFKMRFYRKRGKLCIFFGKVPHSSFASRGHVCINTEDPTLVITLPPHSLPGKNFGALKFGDQASIRQNLLPPIFSVIQYFLEILDKNTSHLFQFNSNASFLLLQLCLLQPHSNVSIP